MSLALKLFLVALTSVIGLLLAPLITGGGWSHLGSAGFWFLYGAIMAGLAIGNLWRHRNGELHE